MSASAAISTTVHSSTSIDVRTEVIPRATWRSARTSEGFALHPMKGTWYGHVIRGRERHDVTVVAIVGCPSCGKMLMLSHSLAAAQALRAMTGMPVPVSHQIDALGKVSPDIRCMHKGCGFHRKVYLDRWNKTKPLFAVAYVNLRTKEIEIAYSHAVDAREAIFHLGANRRDIRVITTPDGRPAAGPAVGFYVDERTGRVTAD
jgi:hypothetical protein